jgi:nitrogen regulatory protein PII 2
MNGMKQIIAIIRDECVEPTLAALARMGISVIAILPVLGRGLQKGNPGIPGQEGALGRNAGHHLRRGGECASSTPPVYHPPQKKKPAPGFLPKQMLMLLVPDEQAAGIVQALITINQSGRHGDGKIFVCPIGRVFGDEGAV